MELTLEAALAGITLIQGLLAWRIEMLRREIKKGNKDQQEIKTRLAWIKKRQKGEA